DLVRFERDDGVRQCRRQLRTRVRADEYPLTVEEEVDGHDRRQGARRHRQSPERRRTEEPQALVALQYLQAVAVGVHHWTMNVVTMPYMPVSRSAWLRMWQWKAHTPLCA